MTPFTKNTLTESFVLGLKTVDFNRPKYTNEVFGLMKYSKYQPLIRTNSLEHLHIYSIDPNVVGTFISIMGMVYSWSTDSLQQKRKILAVNFAQK